MHFFCIALGMGYSIMSGGLTLACMVLPILIRTTEQAILAVPDDYRHAAAGLGLSVGRALAETAAWIFTAGYVTRMPESLQDSGRSMSVHIYDLALNVPGGSSQAYATAAVLVVLLLIINAVAIVLMRLAGLRMPGSPGGSI
jgi:phosphate transport system permease protein